MQEEERYAQGYQNTTASPMMVDGSNAHASNNSNNSNNHPSSSSCTLSVSSAGSSEEEFHNGSTRYHQQEADLLAKKLMACNDNEDLEKIVLRRSLDIPYQNIQEGQQSSMGMGYGSSMGMSMASRRRGPLFQSRRTKGADRSLLHNMVAMISLALLGLIIIFVLLQISTIVVGPPSEPVGPYKLIELQEGESFFNNYVFYSGKDSAGSKGYVNYVDKGTASELKIANVTYEKIDRSVYGDDFVEEESEIIGFPPVNGSTDSIVDAVGNQQKEEKGDETTEPFVYMSTSATREGPRNSVRLEGLRRFNRGLFILDLRHMPSGCATWPAWWLTDEPNWPVNGEIDILEGVNRQTHAKTALHTTQTCTMNDVPLGVKTGSWDTATGVPKKNGDIDHSIREAKDCFVYNPHQWLNQGCVQTDKAGTIGEPLNDNGGGVFVLEWDPINSFIKSWVFSPHTEVPKNLKLALKSANDGESKDGVRPDPRTWGLPYAFFPIGTGTNCPSDHFKNMHLIFNMALCGSVAGNRFAMDCPLLNEKYGTCENYIRANTSEMDEIYWKIRGVYVYEREWERSWVD